MKTNKIIILVTSVILLVSVNCFAGGKGFGLFGIKSHYTMKQVAETMTKYGFSAPEDYQIGSSHSMTSITNDTERNIKFGLMDVRIKGRITSLDRYRITIWVHKDRECLVREVYFKWSMPFGDNSILLSITSSFDDEYRPHKELLPVIIKAYGKPKIKKDAFYKTWKWYHPNETFSYGEVGSMMAANSRASIEIIYYNNIDKVYEILQEAIKNQYQ